MPLPDFKFCVCVRMFDHRSHPQGKGELYFDSVCVCVVWSWREDARKFM